MERTIQFRVSNLESSASPRVIGTQAAFVTATNQWGDEIKFSVPMDDAPGLGQEISAIVAWGNDD